MSVPVNASAKELLDFFLNHVQCNDLQSFHDQNEVQTELIHNQFKVLDINNETLETKGFNAKVCVSSANLLETGLPDTISTYVLFLTKSNETKSTEVYPSSLLPEWNFTCDVELSIDMLRKGNKPLVFQVWKTEKNLNSVNSSVDFLIGTVDIFLSDFLQNGLEVKKAFNIFNSSGEICGMLNLEITPLEDLAQFQLKSTEANDNCDESVGLNNGMFSRALKRKFNELDQIAHRLKCRLAQITSDEFDECSDELADRFEQDINTTCLDR